jgi:hypothetical protein
MKEASPRLGLSAQSLVSWKHFAKKQPHLLAHRSSGSQTIEDPHSLPLVVNQINVPQVREVA